MKFSDILGQDEVKSQLALAVQENRLGHAILLLGEDGYGTLSMARALATYLQCENRTAHDACGNCKSCSRSTSFNHPDIIYSFPFVADEKHHTAMTYGKQWREILISNPYLTLTEWTKAHAEEKKSANINAAECEEIIRQLHYKALGGEERILILWKPEYLGKEGNKLLKVIEEPPMGSRIIFAATEADQIINTILSRTQSYPLQPLAPDLLTAFLIEKKGIPASTAATLAEAAKGDLNIALQFNSENIDPAETKFIQFIGLMKRNDFIGLQPWIEEMAASSRDYQKYFLTHILEVLEWKLTAKYKPAHPVYETKWGNLLPNLSEDAIENLANTMNKAHKYVNRNVQSKLLWTNLAIIWAKSLRTEKK